MENGVFRVQIYTKEYEQMRHFYGTVLRLPVLVCRETGRDDRVCVYGAASGQIEVIYAPPGMEVPVSNGWTLQMQVENADRYCEQLQAQGWTIQREPQNQFWGHRNFKVLDPSGLELTIYSDIPGKETEKNHAD